MRPIFYVLLVFMACGFGSCTRHQVIRLASDHPQTLQRAFVVETDTLLLTYNFSGEGGPVAISIYNKLNHPLFIDWRQSSLIVGGQVFPYVEGPSEGYVYEALGGPFGALPLRSSQDVALVPPHSYLQSPLFWLAPTPYQGLPGDVWQERRGGRLFKRQGYSAATSPVYIRSYLAFGTDRPLTHPFYQQTTFWLEEVLQTTSARYVRLVRNEQWGDTFTVQQQNDSRVLAASSLTLLSSVMMSLLLVAAWGG
ncbi:hypothetical protein SAMN05421823_111241 [Catalinimonas alkaloidigena]|uniref:Uncharacterized protein n=1 Tax=Catalinimonas alkaloidigena TaxID=1075417 RepID=A0A1G9RRC6_9BACT|nr:hypothetical protein [Catalinimonas alkaloidigena]SDM25771.1 hypothetical protein SAMN05421823_111241 [Catalinimonas alkaloidigena]